MRKTRYLVPGDGGLTVELDVYSGELDGLLVAEIEFDSTEAAAAFRWSARSPSASSAQPSGAGSVTGRSGPARTGTPGKLCRRLRLLV